MHHEGTFGEESRILDRAHGCSLTPAGGRICSPFVAKQSESAQATSEKPTGEKTSRAVWWVAGFLALASVEFFGAFVVQARVVPDSDWVSAADFVGDEWQDGDTVVSSPGWTDPLLRQHFAEHLSVQDAGRADFASYSRVWELSIRGHSHEEFAELEPDFSRRFGRVTLRRYTLQSPRVLYDFTSNIGDAEVSIPGRECPKQQRALEGGGLFRGPMWPAERFFCGPDAWLWVGQTVIEDLEMQNRYCVWQHPQAGNVPTTTTFRDVPLGDELVLHAGIYYEHERNLENGPVHVQVLVDGEEVGRMVHRDGDGWEGMSADPTPLGEDKARGDVSIVVSAENPHLRTLCWAASSRETPERSAR